MASFDENGKYIKTNWKAGDKITATKLNKIEESIEAVNDNDISRHVEADARLDALEAKDVAHDKELTNIKNTIADNKAAAELGDYDINSRMTFLENELNEGIEEVHNVASTVDGKIAAADASMTAQVNQGKADMEAMVAEVESEMIELQNDVSEIQNDVSEIQNDMNDSLNAQCAVINDYKFILDDEDMVSSLITLDNIEGMSSIDTNSNNKFILVSRRLNNIYTIDTSKNYFEGATIFSKPENVSCEITGNDLSMHTTSSTGELWYGARVTIPDLIEGKKYICICDDVEITSGHSYIEIQGNSLDTNRMQDSMDLAGSFNNKTFIYDNSFMLAFHCTVGAQTGNVTYRNIQIYEVKEMTVPDIQLNSLPNGVKDEIKDGMLIKRTGIVNLADLTWVCNYSSDTMISFYSTLDNIALASDYNINDNNILSNMFQCTSTNVVDDFSIAGDFTISGYHVRPEIKIRLPISSGVSDANSLIAWLSNNNAHAVYELSMSEYIPVNLTIKADKGDTVVINTTKTMDFTYDIQLNTRAQIDALQERQCLMTYMHRDINNMKKAYDNIQIGDPNGYCELPNGLIMQWGSVDNVVGTDQSHKVIFPIPFKQGLLNIQLTGRWFNTPEHYWAVSNTDYKTYAYFHKQGNLEVSDAVYWFAIGI